MSWNLPVNCQRFMLGIIVPGDNDTLESYGVLHDEQPIYLYILAPKKSKQVKDKKETITENQNPGSSGIKQQDAHHKNENKNKKVERPADIKQTGARPKSTYHQGARAKSAKKQTLSPNRRRIKPKDNTRSKGGTKDIPETLSKYRILPTTSTEEASLPSTSKTTRPTTARRRQVRHSHHNGWI